MANMSRVRVRWDIDPGGPGVSTFYAVNPAPLRAALHDFFFALKEYIPNTAMLTIEPFGDIIDASDGTLTGTWSDPTPLTVGGTFSGNYAAPVGIVVRWVTGIVADGARVVGRTFFVPLAGVAFSLDGSPSPDTISSWQGNAAALVASQSSNMVVWHRPRTVALPKHPVHPGVFAFVVSAVAVDKSAVLRSRRA